MKPPGRLSATLAGTRRSGDQREQPPTASTSTKAAHRHNLSGRARRV